MTDLKGTMGAERFFKVLTKHEKPNETIHHVVINENGKLATLNGIHHWLENGKRKGQGQVIWLLEKKDGEWRIVYHAWQGLN